jgi:hypothetical protein
MATLYSAYNSALRIFVALGAGDGKAEDESEESRADLRGYYNLHRKL